MAADTGTLRLTVRYSPYYPPDRCWIWTVTGGYGERWQGWRATYPEAVELGIEDLLALDAAKNRVAEFERNCSLAADLPPAASQ